MTDGCVQLHAHSSLSFRDGLPSEATLVQRAAELGQPGVGLTNHGHLYGAQRFYQACADHGVKGAIGMEVYEAVHHTWDPDPAGPHHAIFKEKYDPNRPRYFHLTLWAMDLTGWQNLCWLHTHSFTPGFKPKNQPLIDRATLEQHSAGIICGLGCPQSRANWMLSHKGYDAALEVAKWNAEVFEDRLYVEVMAVLAEQVRALPEQRKLAKTLGCSCVGTNDVHYLYKDDGKLGGPHHVLVQARKFKSAATADTQSADRSDDSYGAWYGSDGFYMKTRAEMLQAGIYADEVDTSLEILERISFDLSKVPEPQPPVAPIPAPGTDPDFDNWLKGDAPTPN